MKHQWHAPQRWTGGYHSKSSSESKDGHIVEVNVFADMDSDSSSSNWHRSDDDDHSHRHTHIEHRGSYKWNDGPHSSEDDYERMDAEGFVQHNINFHSKDSKEMMDHTIRVHEGMGDRDREHAHGYGPESEDAEQTDELEEEVERELVDWYNEADGDGDGRVSFGELVRNVEEVQDTEEDRLIFGEVDRNQDGFVTFDEFKVE